ncbi:MAG TPA: SDR family oxidoreductase [Stenotrophobium sp.]|jgi:nucleoside-diphosphate-sugar epimerase|nr:SDR family oxidoreductase [Stenotrophobium sp.]
MLPIPEDTLPQHVLIVGCGDIGTRVAVRLRAMGREVTGVVRSDQSAADLRSRGIAARPADLDEPAALPATPLVFYFAPPPAAGETDTRLRAALAQWPAGATRIVYISTSGVYGDCAGRWIDETEPLKPLSARARRRLDAERALAQWGGDHVLLRVPGIYGPGRLPLARLREALPVILESESPYTNRIHADDLAEAALHAAVFGRAGAAYNISDGRPTTMCDYFTRCARLLGMPPPPQVTRAEARRVFTPAMWSFMEESKRLLNRRMLDELRYLPRYPDLERGLAACLPPA